MAIGVYFHPASMSAAQYDEIMKRLDAAGAAKPAGRLYHTCFGSGDSHQVFDVWESQESFGKFGQTLMPNLQDLGLDAGEPMVEEIHNIVAG